MTLHDLQILKSILCSHDEDYTKPTISAEYLEHELEELFLILPNDTMAEW